VCPGPRLLSAVHRFGVLKARQSDQYTLVLTLETNIGGHSCNHRPSILSRA